ncbi:MAG: Crp/Fnr family transcriptional regulator [Pseudolabrys sp.]|nr:Crp/Fnr family transcriptional regulator [Pseudolabrys sp.]
MSWLPVLGYSAALLSVAMLAMRTMVPLRMAGIAANICSIAFGGLTGVYPMLLQHAILLPLNSYRLWEMLKLVKRVKAASDGDLSVEWIKPFMTKRSIPTGHVLFRRGDEADKMYLLVSGGLHLNEINIDVQPGVLVGEMGMLAPGGRRTQTLEASEDSTVLEMSYDHIEQLYFQNPQFGFYFLRLTTRRLFENVSRLEGKLAERDQEIAELRAKAA